MRGIQDGRRAQRRIEVTFCLPPSCTLAQNQQQIGTATVTEQLEAAVRRKFALNGLHRALRTTIGHCTGGCAYAAPAWTTSTELSSLACVGERPILVLTRRRLSKALPSSNRGTMRSRQPCALDELDPRDAGRH